MGFMIRSMRADHNLNGYRLETQAMDEAKRGRLQFSVRTLLLVTAAAALLLVPVAWVTRERRQMMLAQQEILLAREVALRSVVREQRAPPRNSGTRPLRIAPRRRFKPGPQSASG